MQPARKVYAGAFVTGLLLTFMLCGFLGLIWVAQIQRNHERVVSRLLICREIEAVKRAQVEDIDRRLDSSRAFLAAHPNGIPGIGRDLILQGIRNTLKTRRSLAPIDCQKFAHHPTQEAKS